MIPGTEEMWRDIGYADGRAGQWNPPNSLEFQGAYSAGWNQGQQEIRR